MKIEKGTVILAATDLANHIGCHYLSGLNLAVATGTRNKPDWKNPQNAALIERGIAHEKAFIEKLGHDGLNIHDLEDQGSIQETIKAMQAGFDIIVQAPLGNARWYGIVDILRKVDRKSKLGSWSYEALDTKLSHETRGSTILQMCLYTNLIEEIQGITPEYFRVVKPGNEFVEEVFRVSDYYAYFGFLRDALASGLSQPEAQSTILTNLYPEPVTKCEFCNWERECRDRRVQDDHLSLVANITRVQRRELESQDVRTLTSLAKWEQPNDWRPSRGETVSYKKVRHQAEVQLKTRENNRIHYDDLPIEPDFGLSALPEPSGGDIFFDIESDPFVGESGLEYLLGYCYFPTGSAAENPIYEGIWGLDYAKEKTAFEKFIDFITNRLQEFPDLHIYHYAPYEPSAIKRLMGRHGTRENQVDFLLRSKRFVDLLQVVRRSVRVGIERYSLKDLEPLYQFSRQVELKDASRSLNLLAYQLEMNDADGIDPKTAESVLHYNEDDCLSTWHLRNWLEERRNTLIAGGASVSRPVIPPGELQSPERTEAQNEIDRLKQELSAGLEGDPDTFSEDERGRWLLAQLLEFHQREQKSQWWEYFRLTELPPDEYLHEKSAIYGLNFLRSVGGTAACPVHQYQFPPQEVDLRSGAECHFAKEKYGEIESIDKENRTLDIKKNRKSAAQHPIAVFGHSIVPDAVLRAALQCIAKSVVAHGFDRNSPYSAAFDLLLRQPPRLSNGLVRSTLRQDNESTIEAAKRIVIDLQGGVLSIQGPPGTGKTHTAAEMIIACIQAGLKVGITALSHKVIRNLIEKVCELSLRSQIPVRCCVKVKEITAGANGNILETTDNAGALNFLRNDTPSVLGGTAWLWARPEFANAVDVLFVDEAGQYSLADTLVVSQAGRNLVLLGDPQQLERPIQGTHPPGCDLSALEHLFGQNQTTVSADKGLFLEETWRMTPAICEFISDQFYESKLHSKDGCQFQEIQSSSQFKGSGLFYVPVEHTGNQSHSPEEIAVIGRIIDDLLDESSTYTDRHGATQPLTLQNILIVAPYNSQVSYLQGHIPGARVGTVDKFQGQEAAIVIYSLTTSTPEDAPRGMEFLYSRNRFNVAISRATCIAIVVGNPMLFQPECHAPRQMKLANAFCAFSQKAKLLEL